MKDVFTLLKLNDKLSLSYGFDDFSRIYLMVVVTLFAFVLIYSLEYMKHKEHKVSYYASFFMTFFAMTMMSFSANIFTFYVNYELMTLSSAPMVMHDRTKEALKAGFKYLIYSFFGAYFVLFGFFTLGSVDASFDFVPGGTEIMSGTLWLVRLAVFGMVLGFSVKAGMWPMHAWLTSAHPVAVSPASALLSGAVVSAGAAGIIRLLRYTVSDMAVDGTKVSLFEGTVYQKIWLGLILATIVMGSLLAFFEPVLKRRLAYSTISQMSYILFGLALCSETAYDGAIMQLVAHAFAKCALFLIAGLFIKLTGCTKVDDFKGIGKKHPFILTCFLIASLSMIGIPPTGGFAAKWFLLSASLESSGFPVWLGPIALMASALLTAGYLLPIVLKGFMPGEDFEYVKDNEKVAPGFSISIGVLTLLSLLTGLILRLFV